MAATGFKELSVTTFGERFYRYHGTELPIFMFLQPICSCGNTGGILFAELLTPSCTAVHRRYTTVQIVIILRSWIGSWRDNLTGFLVISLITVTGARSYVLPRDILLRLSLGSVSRVSDLRSRVQCRDFSPYV